MNLVQDALTNNIINVAAVGTITVAHLPPAGREYIPSSAVGAVDITTVIFILLPRKDAHMNDLIISAF